MNRRRIPPADRPATRILVVTLATAWLSLAACGPTEPARVGPNEIGEPRRVRLPAWEAVATLELGRAALQVQLRWDDERLVSSGSAQELPPGDYTLQLSSGPCAELEFATAGLEIGALRIEQAAEGTEGTVIAWPELEIESGPAEPRHALLVLSHRAEPPEVLACARLEPRGVDSERTLHTMAASLQAIEAGGDDEIATPEADAEAPGDDA